MYDAIVIGARCAGSPLAMLLARSGHNVLVVDRSTFPSDRLSTHFLKRTGASYLRDWGLLDAVAEIGTPQIRHHAMHVGGVALRGSAPPYRGVDADYTPRRVYLDKLLVDAAAEAGAEVRESFSVSDLIFENGRVVGVRGAERGGHAVEERARVVIGADGLQSLVARSVGARTYFDAGSQSCAYYAYYSGMRDRDDAAELHFLDERRFIISFPTNDDLDVVFLFWPVEEADRVRSDLDAAFSETLGLVPELNERVRSGKRETRFTGMRSVPNFFREAHGPGWALVGDAAHHRDPITAQGITSAFIHAAILAEELNPVLSGDGPLHLALGRYEQRQFARLKPMYDYTVDLARLIPFSPEQRQLLTALTASPEAVDAFIGSFIGSVPLEQVFPPETLGGFARVVDDLARTRETQRKAI